MICLQHGPVADRDVRYPQLLAQPIEPSLHPNTPRQQLPSLSPSLSYAALTADVHSSRMAYRGVWYSRRHTARRCCSPRLSTLAQSMSLVSAPGMSSRCSSCT